MANSNTMQPVATAARTIGSGMTLLGRTFNTLMNGVSDVAGKALLSGAIISGAVAVSPVGQKFLEDVRSPADLKDKIAVMSGIQGASRSFMISPSMSAKLNPEQQQNLNDAASFINKHPHLRLDFYTANPDLSGEGMMNVTEIKIALIEREVDTERLIGKLGASKDHLKNSPSDHRVFVTITVAKPDQEEKSEKPSSDIEAIPLVPLTPKKPNRMIL